MGGFVPIHFGIWNDLVHSDPQASSRSVDCVRTIDRWDLRGGSPHFVRTLLESLGPSEMDESSVRHGDLRHVRMVRLLSVLLLGWNRLQRCFGSLLPLVGPIPKDGTSDCADFGTHRPHLGLGPPLGGGWDRPQATCL